MSVDFSRIRKVIDNRALVIMPNPRKVLINFWELPGPRKLSTEYMYALKASRLKQYKNLQNMSLLVYEDIPIAADYYQVNGLNIVITKNAGTFAQLKFEIQGIFDEQAKINNYAYDLMNLCHQNADKQKLMDAGYSFLNNPLLLVDSTLALIAHAGVYSNIDEPVIDYCLTNNHMPVEFLNEMMSEHFSQSDDEFPELIILEQGVKNYTSSSIVAGRVVRGSQLLGYVKLFEYNHPITDLEKRCLIILCDFLSIALTDSIPRLPMINIQIEDFITDLLSRRITSKEAIEARSFLYHLDDNREQYFISIKYDNQKTNMDRLHFFKKQLQRMFNPSCITFYNQLIVMVIAANTLHDNRKALQNFLSANDLRASISMRFTNFIDIYKYYSQTLACMDIMTRFSLKNTIIDYNDWKLVHIFLCFQEYCNLLDLIPEDIRILQNADKSKGTNLVETLFSFIHHRQNVTETASALHLHYNTMKYRITQITDLTNIEFDNYEYMFNIMIAEKVMQILDNDASILPFSSHIVT